MTDQQLDQLFKDGLAQEQAFEGAEKKWTLIKQELKPSHNYFFTISMLLFGSFFLIFYLSQHKKDFSKSTTITVKQEPPLNQDNLKVNSKDDLLKEKQRNYKLKKSSVAIVKDNQLKTNSLKPPNQEEAFSTQNEKLVTNKHSKNIERELQLSKEKKSSHKIEDKYKPELVQNLITVSDKITPSTNKSLIQKNRIVKDEQARPNRAAAPYTSDLKKPFKANIKNEMHNKALEKLNSIQAFLATSPTAQLDRSVAKVGIPSIFGKKDSNKKWTILAGLSFNNLLNQTSNANVKDSSSVIRNFGLHYTANNKFTIGLHYKFNTVAKKIKRIDNIYNLPELPSLSESENVRENISLVYERNLFNLLLGYHAYKNDHIYFTPFVGLQSGYFPPHTIKYGINEVYGEQDLTSLVPAKFYLANDLLLGINVTVNITGSISINARYEYQLSLNNNYNWQTPHLVSTFIAVKF